LRKSHGIRLWQVRIKETSANEPLMRCRKIQVASKLGAAELQDESRGRLFTAWAVLGIKAA